MLLLFVVDLLLGLQDCLLVAKLDQLGVFQVLATKLLDLLSVALLVGLDLFILELQLPLEVLCSEFELVDELLLLVS